MFDEEGRKINIGYQVGMNLEPLSTEELHKYIHALNDEIKRAELEITRKKASIDAAASFFK
jgi:uncharacterized small protein (DUF1192 family)